MARSTTVLHRSAALAAIAVAFGSIGGVASASENSFGWASIGTAVGASATQTSPPTNPAAIYDEIALRLDGEPTDPNRVALLGNDAQQRIQDLLDGGPVTAEVRADLARVRDLLELAHQASAIRDIDRGLDRSQGMMMLLPHLSSMRQVTRLMMADASIRLADGDVDGAARAFGTTYAMAGHVTEDRLLISTLVAGAMGSLGSAHLQRAIDLGAIDAEQARAILSAAERLNPNDPYGFGGAIDGELEMIRATVDGVLAADPIFDEVVDGRAGILGDDLENPFSDVPEEELRAQLDAIEGIYADVAEAIADPDPEMAKRRLAVIEDRISAGEGGVLGEVMLPAFSRAFDFKLRAEAALAPLEQLKAIASGEKSPGDFTNAAHWLREAARAARRLDEDEQRLLEAMRIAPEAFDGEANEPLRDEVHRIVERYRDAIVEPMLLASRAGRCRFDSTALRLHQTTAIRDEAPGVRGAMRFMLVDAMIAPSTSSDPAAPTVPAPSIDADDDALRGAHVDGDDAESVASPVGTDPPVPTEPPSPLRAGVECLVAALRIVELIAEDASIGHAVLATALLGDVVATMPRLLHQPVPGRSGPDHATIVAVRTAIERMDRTDPLGHRRGLDADRRTLIHLYGSDEPTRSKRQALAARLSANQVFAVALAMQGLRDSAARPCDLIDRGVLLSLRDIHDADACAALQEMRDEIATQAMVLRATRETPATVRDPLGGLTLPIATDAENLAHRAVTLIAKLDQIVRRAAASAAGN